MRAYLREKMMQRLAECPTLSSRYLAGGSDCVPRIMRWLEGVEDDLSRLRSPLAGKVSSELMKLASAREGNLPHGTVSKRKAVRFQAVQAVETVEALLRGEIVRIDEKFNEWGDKIAQLAAISSRRSPIHIDGELGDAALRQIWKQFGVHQEGANMHQYLSAVMPQADLLYLLHDIISNLLNNNGHDNG